MTAEPPRESLATTSSSCCARRFISFNAMATRGWDRFTKRAPRHDGRSLCVAYTNHGLAALDCARSGSFDSGFSAAFRMVGLQPGVPSLNRCAPSLASARAGC